MTTAAGTRTATTVLAVTAVRSRHVYRHAGLTLAVNERLPDATETNEVDVDVDVSIMGTGEVALLDLPWSSVAPFVWRAPDEEGTTWLRARYEIAEQWAEFVIDGSGSAAWISHSPGVRLSEVTDLLFGQMFSCLASQRGLTCLHSSVVRVEDRVMAMIGRSGAGKSSTALSLVKWAGGELVADDVAVLSESHGRVSVAVGPPRLRMREDPGRELVTEYDALDPVFAEDRRFEPKRYLRVERAAAREGDDRLPVDVLYFLAPFSDEVSEPVVRDLSPIAALPRLMAERHMMRLVSKGADRVDFDRLARLLRAAPARELLRPAGLDTLRKTVETVVSDVRALG